ncbi:DUF5712 family protein [Leeuwenhoekiella polynyae]|uniref:Mobilization protein B n=1 Tax=Leeuwenhoekiella polynyae TaxID=1550906 RepID=A0A4Q0NQI2_9FLAO|nr:DUF5712 family protein [Leeuwenhoekiella polynyae]RXG12822.1 hypothetical protein DSM02_3826 [Leeuwenhoekiella polynyae]
MPISKPHSTLGTKNTGSCATLTNYLDKENRELETLINNKNNLNAIGVFQSRKQDFFNHSRVDISAIEVIDSIDNNIKKLGKTDAKYFAPTISFSQTELQHIISLASKRKEINSVWQLTSNEYDKYNKLLKDYVKKVMDNYAVNFNRQDKGLKTGKDLLYFAKIEHFRKFRGTDDEVKKGIFKTGDYKPGLNSHAHIVVSRKDRTQRLKLTPTTKERSTQRSIGGNSYQVGFDRMKWITNNEKSFDDFFQYRRTELEKFQNQYILKNGSPKEKDELAQKIKRAYKDRENNLKLERSSKVRNLGR